jgi:phosphoadenosine phosphosulfate reductase
VEETRVISAEEIAVLNESYRDQSPEALLGWAWKTFGDRAAIGTSFQGAGLVIMHLCRTQGFKFPIFTLDTGLLFPETVALRKQLEEFLGVRIEALTPDLSVEAQAAAHGDELWKRDPDLCCTLRKVLPLGDKLRTLEVWITGLRRQQSETRGGTGLIELYSISEDSDRTILKLNPLAHWTREAVWEYLRRHAVPYNPLHDQGYRSIGCRPCTTQATEGADERAGRWTGFGKTECGIHTFMARKA